MKYSKKHTKERYYEKDYISISTRNPISRVQ